MLKDVFIYVSYQGPLVYLNMIFSLLLFAVFAIIVFLLATRFVG